MPLELVDDCRLALGEGVVWDSRAERLYWIGIADRQVRWLDRDGAVGPAADRKPQVLRLDTCPGTLAPYRDGRVLLAVEDGFALLDTADGSLESVARVEADRPERRMNDGKCDPYGRIVAGTMTFEDPRVGGPLYRLEYDADGTARVVALRGGMLIPNGLDWPEPDLLWHIDTPTSSISLFAYPEHGPLADPVRTLDVSALGGDPDGMTLDAEGNLWVAFWGGSAVRCLSREGKVLETVELPTGKVSSCAFGGPDLDVLYVTTAGGGEPGADEGAGSLYRYAGLTTGRPSRHWAGPAGA